MVFTWSKQWKHEFVKYVKYFQNAMSWRNTGYHLRGFLNSSKGWEGGVVGGESEIPLEKILYQVKETLGDVILVIRTFFKAKNSFLWILNIN